MRKRVGLIVNPVAGMGGRVGLKGSDGSDILKKALELGANPEAPRRVVEALKKMFDIRESMEILTYPGEMGEDEARECGFEPITLGTIQKGKTTSQDTRSAAKEMLSLGIDLLLFAGGDGTARDIHSIVGESLPVLGIPAGVKMHSGVFAINPQSAGDLAVIYLSDKSEALTVREAEVIDIDEQAFREDRIATKLYGYLRVPYERGRVQSAKEGSILGEDVSIDLIASDVINNMQDDFLYLIGAGTTTRAVMEKMGLKHTLLGVDVVFRKSLVGLDLNESQLLEILDGKKAKLVVGITGRQGYVFGRGNQQISPNVISRVGRDNIIIVATTNKVLSLAGGPLLVDTGDNYVDQMLSGYIQIVSGLGQRIVLKINK